MKTVQGILFQVVNENDNFTWKLLLGKQVWAYE